MTVLDLDKENRSSTSWFVSKSSNLSIFKKTSNSARPTFDVDLDEWQTATFTVYELSQDVCGVGYMNRINLK